MEQESGLKRWICYCLFVALITPVAIYNNYIRRRTNNVTRGETR